MSQLVQCFSFILAAGAFGRVRLCPWNDTATHVEPGSRIKFRIEARGYAISSLRTAVWECYQTRDASGNRLPFDPAAGPMRRLDRDQFDTINLIDPLNIDPELFGFELWHEGPAPVKEARSPTFTVSQDMTPPGPLGTFGDREYVLEVQSVEGGPVSLEVFVEIIPPAAPLAKSLPGAPAPQKRAEPIRVASTNEEDGD